MKKIEAFKQEKSYDTGWTVRYGDLWADNLTEGEALEVVATIILTGRAPYLKTDLQNFLWDWKYGWREQPALLPETVRRSP